MPKGKFWVLEKLDAAYKTFYFGQSVLFLFFFLFIQSGVLVNAYFWGLSSTTLKEEEPGNAVVNEHMSHR